MINGQLDDNIYHIEIDNNSDGKNIIEIHLKNIYSLEHKLGEKNVYLVIRLIGDVLWVNIKLIQFIIQKRILMIFLLKYY